MAIKNNLLHAKIMHHRLTPKKNAFLYKQYYIFLKASEIWQSKSKLLSINRFNVFAFLFKKYGKLNGENPYFYARQLIEEKCQNLAWLEGIYVLTQPSILGWSFNPVSFWFYMDFDGQIRAVLSEVNNTFGESHKYFAHHDGFTPIQPKDVLTASKVLYVSPFYKVEGEYQFQFNITHKSLGVWINYFVDHQKTLMTSVTGSFESLNDLSLLKAFFKMPLANFKTIILIHWQALAIWLKGVKYIHRKTHKKQDVSRCR